MQIEQVASQSHLFLRLVSPSALPLSVQHRAFQQLVYFVLLAFLLLLAGCNARVVKQQGSDLANVGAATSMTLGSYYRSLIDDTIDSHEFNAFDDGFKGTTPDAEQHDRREKILLANLEALQTRANLAAHLKRVYEALGSLSGSDAPDKARTAAAGLAGAVLAVRRTPLSDPAAAGAQSLVGMVAEDLLVYIQSKKIIEAEQLTRKLQQGTRDLFLLESDAYLQISAFRADKASTVSRSLLDKGAVNPWPLLERVLMPFGVSLMNAKAFPTDPAVIEGFQQLMLARTNRLSELSSGATTAMSEALSDLAKAHEEFPATGSLDGAISNLDRVKSYVDAIRTVRNN